jgi:hypothetical protein
MLFACFALERWNAGTLERFAFCGFCVFAFLRFCVFAFLRFCVFAFLRFCVFALGRCVAVSLPVRLHLDSLATVRFPCAH